MQKSLALAFVALLSISLLACGPSKKKDPLTEDELSSTGNRQRNGRGGGGGTPQEPETFEQYCQRIEGRFANNVCQIKKFEFSVSAPKQEEMKGTFQKFIVQAHRGMVIKTIGDPSEIASLYMAGGSSMTHFMPIGAQFRSKVLPLDVSLFLVADIWFEKPARILGYECVDSSHNVTGCPQI